MYKVPYKPVILIFVISCLIQGIFIATFKAPLKADQTFYDSVANNLLNGKGFSQDGVVPLINVKPAYVLFLAGIYKIFGHNLYIVRALQAVCVALSCCVVFLIGKEVFNERTGLISGIAMALYPPIWAVSDYIISEALFLFVLALTAFFFIKGQKSDSKRMYVYSAILLGLSTQIRPTSVFLPFFIPFGFMGLKDGFMKARFPFFMGIIMVLLFLTPMTIRNYVQFGLFRPVEGIGMIWMGTFTEGGASEDNPLTKKAFFALRAQEKSLASDKKMSEVKVEDAYIRHGFENILKRPMDYIRFFPKKVMRLWIGSYSGLFNIGTPFSDFISNPRIILLYPFVFFWKTLLFLLSCIVAAGGLIGMVVSDKKRIGALFLICVVLYFTLLHMLVYANTRFGIPALPYLIIFSVISLEKFALSIKK